MRVGDFSVEVVPHGNGRVREIEAGHVLARPGQVYRLRLRNHGPLYSVAHVDLDGQRVTAGGLVLAPWSVTELERPVDAGEHGRFTVVAEGDESVFGPDGGRDNPALGLIEARFRRELPRDDRRDEMPPVIASNRMYGSPPPRALPSMPDRFSLDLRDQETGFGTRRFTKEAIERAAGTGLTGHSDQQFVPFQLGPLETEETLVRLRLVIGSEEALSESTPRPLVERQAPARPLARP